MSLSQLYGRRLRPRIPLVLCACRRRYLNNPLAGDFTERGFCDLCERERQRAGRQIKTLAHVEACTDWIDHQPESFSARLQATGDSLVLDRESSVDEEQDAREAGFHV